MSFDHLDDPMPPELDGARWDRIQRRARARRARGRAAVALASIAAVIAAGGAVALAARGNDHHSTVVVGATTTAPSLAESTSTAAPITTAPRDANVWVTVELHLDRTTIMQGEDVTGTIVFHNWTDHDVVFTDAHGCLDHYAVAVGARSDRPTIGFVAMCIVARHASGAVHERGTGLEVRPA